MILKGVFNLIKGIFKGILNIITDLPGTIKKITEAGNKVLSWYYEGTIQRIKEDMEKKKLINFLKGELGIKGLELGDANKIRKELQGVVGELNENIKWFSENLQNINFEELNKVLTEYINNLHIILNTTIKIKGQDFKIENLLTKQSQDLIEIRTLWGAIIESVKAYNKTIEESIKLLQDLYKQLFSLGDLYKKYLNELLKQLPSKNISIEKLIFEDLQKFKDITKDIYLKYQDIIRKLQNLKINIDFKKVNIKELKT
jgi:hypothetical protein